MKVPRSCPNKFQYTSTGKIETRVTYIEMLARPQLEKVNSLLPYDIRPYQNRAAETYLDLYHHIGNELNWTGRKLISRDQLEAVVLSPLVDIQLLMVADEVAGFVEFDLRESQKNIEIGFFGIAASFYGKKLGISFLHWAIEYAWVCLNAERLWLHTCDLDHPKALVSYVRNGFSIYKEAKEEVDEIAII